jgi:hypothetical protein
VKPRLPLSSAAPGHDAVSDLDLLLADARAIYQRE